MKKEWKWFGFYCLTACVLLLCVNAFSHTITVLAEREPIERQHCVIVDPGHGGEDGGAVSVSGLAESKYNLEIALKVNDLLNLLGYDTKMTRRTDISVYTNGETLAQKKASDLKERVRQINETERNLLVSIHQNHFPDEKYSGAQVFYGMVEGSKELAEQMQKEFAQTLNKGSKRMAKKSSGVYLMEHIHCPGILVECGFLSNRAEEARLREATYQKKVSCVIAATVSQYLSNT